MVMGWSIKTGILAKLFLAGNAMLCTITRYVLAPIFWHRQNFKLQNLSTTISYLVFTSYSAFDTTNEEQTQSSEKVGRMNFYIF